jgi:hypothetical protein
MNAFHACSCSGVSHRCSDPPFGVPRRRVVIRTNSEGLTGFQIALAKLFFDLPASAGFLLAAGAALLAQRQVSSRGR